ncbi:MAG: hypothetical protein WKG07_19920 [Hymenobacter sp.]
MATTGCRTVLRPCCAATSAIDTANERGSIGDDCVRIIHEIVRQAAWGEVFNACADDHPMRRDYYAAAARAGASRCPIWGLCSRSQPKVVSSEKLKAPVELPVPFLQSISRF